MDYLLTSSQKNFYTGNSEVDNVLWNQGVMQVFPTVYNYENLNNAYNLLVKSNDSLRITINDSTNEIMLHLEEHKFIKYPFWQVSSEDELMRKAQEFLNEPLNPQKRLVKCAIFQTPTSSGIMISGHHIVVDGYSAFVMSEHINKYLADEKFSPPAYQCYPEYVKREEKYKSTKRFLLDAEFWKKQFLCKPVCTLYKKDNALFDYNSFECNFEISTELFRKINNLCLSNNISVQTYFNTIFSVYIFRKHGYENFTIGVPVLNRTTEAELNTIGLYMHIVPFVVSVPSVSFIEFAIKNEDALLNIFRHQKFTQYEIKELLKRDGISINQLFDVVFDYQEFPLNHDYEMILPYSNNLSTSLEIHLQSFGDKKHNLKIRYRTSMFTEKEIQTMMNSIIAIAEDAVADPDKKLSELRMVSDNDLNILRSFNSTDHNYTIPTDSTLYSLFEKTAKENADKICLKTAERDMTFGEILDVSENLDSEIRNITDGKKSVIAVIAERSAEMYSAVYGIIRGGNAYLPIDPNYPSDRIEYILSNSNAAAVVCQGKFTHLAGNIPCINMTEFIRNTKKSENILPCCADENDTAYVIYTSGSTGNPKGAKVSHKSAVNRIMWMHDKYPLCSEDVILQKTPYTFDVSVWELFWWGMVGGALAASKPDEHFLPDKILTETQKNKVTHIHFVPSVFEIFLNYLETHKDEINKFDSVKYVFLSGEALSASLVQRFYRLYDFNKVTLHNLYGPTECAVDVTYYDCRPEDTDPVPIGKPIYNTQMRVVDKHMNLVPIGVQGELCIAGVNVGQGYLNNESLTNEKFINNPFGEGKLYKTGDLGYWREDGNIIFIGRNDFQVKIHGQRIELGEIENAVSSVDGIIMSVAVVREDKQKRQFICAFYTGEEKSAKEIKENISGSLPKYMIPNIFVHLDDMPLTSSGKINRKALPEVNLENIESATEYVAPESDTEKFICEAFARVLGTESIGRNSDFFEMGGTSISMISLLSENKFEKITASAFINNSTPAKLAKIINKHTIRNFRYLEELHLPENAKRVMFLIPFAGGGAEAFGNLVSSYKAIDKETEIYFIPYLHSDDECKKASEEITLLAQDKEILLYSHCVGSAVTVRILHNLENNNVPVKHYFAGANIPLAKTTEKNLWNLVPDFLIKTILTKSGAQLSVLSDIEIKEFLKNFKKDTDAANLFLSQNVNLKTPMSAIINKNDIFTKAHKQAAARWKKYFKNVVSVHYIESATHYFQSENSLTLAEIIKKSIS